MTANHTTGFTPYNTASGGVGGNTAELVFGENHTDNWDEANDGDAQGPLLNDPDGNVITYYIRWAPNVTGLPATGGLTYTLNGTDLTQRSFELYFDGLPGETLYGGEDPQTLWLEYNEAEIKQNYSAFNIMNYVAATSGRSATPAQYGNSINYDLVNASLTGGDASFFPGYPNGSSNGTRRIFIQKGFYSQLWVEFTPKASATSDSEAPVITLTGDATINLTVGDTYTEQGATATDNNDGDITANISTTGSVDTNTAGTYTITYNVSDAAGNAATTVARTVNVSAPADTTNPVITRNGAATINLTVGDTYTEQGATATDNVDGDITANISTSGTVNTSVAGTYTVSYNVSDAAGNAATTVTRTVVVSAPADTTNPVITLTGNATINLTVGDTYTEQGATASDNVDGNISGNIQITGSVNTSVAGTYYINYNVSDAAGNASTTVTRTVVVSAPADTTGPVITLVGPSTINITKSDHTQYVDSGANASDAVDGSRPVTTGGDVVDTSTVGTYTVSYTSSDTNNNTTTASRTVNVVEGGTGSPSTVTFSLAQGWHLIGSNYNGTLQSNGAIVGNLYRYVNGSDTYTEIADRTIVADEGYWIRVNVQTDVVLNVSQ